MNPLELIDLVLRPHQVSVTVSGPWSPDIEVTVLFPDLRSAPRTVWGDWGPMYTVCVPPDRPIEMLVRRGEHPEERQALDISQLEVESPILAGTRAVTPLMLELPLVEQKMRLRVFYDTQGRVANAELIPIVVATPRRPLYAVQLQEASASPSRGRSSLPAPTGTLGGGRHAAE